MGVIICGLNGTGKSTLGKVLVEKHNFYFIDIEDLYEQEEKFFALLNPERKTLLRKWRIKNGL